MLIVSLCAAAVAAFVCCRTSSERAVPVLVVATWACFSSWLSLSGPLVLVISEVDGPVNIFLLRCGDDATMIGLDALPLLALPGALRWRPLIGSRSYLARRGARAYVYVYVDARALPWQPRL